MYGFPLAMSCCVKISNIPSKFVKYIDVPLFKAVIEVPGVSILTYKANSKECGKCWQKVAETLNTIEGFQVAGRGVRERIWSLLRSRKQSLIRTEKL